jgi:hypothetical protein
MSTSRVPRCRTLVRFVAPARERVPGAPVEFMETLPGPHDCWLEGDAGRHTSKLRLVALDRAPRDGSSAVP